MESQRKELSKALRITFCSMISALSESEINCTVENEAAVEKFIAKAILKTKSFLPFKIDSEQARAPASTIIGNMGKCYKDLYDDVPKDVIISQLDLWDRRWRVEKEKSKRARHIDTQCFYSKKARTEQALRAIPEENRESLMTKNPTLHMSATHRNIECTASFGIPFNCITPIAPIGSGAYGVCHKVSIEGVSYFPSGIFYAAKSYKGSLEHRLKSYDKEVSVNLRHAGIVRSIGYSNSPELTTIFPYFNGGSIGSMMQLLPYHKGTFVRIVQKIKHKGKIVRPEEPVLSQVDTDRVRAFCNSAPSIVAAIVQSMAYAHSQAIVHCDLHPMNIMLDFTKESWPRVGIIDWGLALRLGMEKRRSLTPEHADLIFRPWLAPELLGTESDTVYSKDVDVFALSWVILQICTFCIEFDAHHETGWIATKVASELQHIELIVKRSYFIRDKYSRKTLAELDAELQRMGLDCFKHLRPITEMMPALY